LICKRELTKSATAISATPATYVDKKVETVARIVTVSVAQSVNTEKLRDLIMQLITVYGGAESEWAELASDNLDETIKCFELLVGENQPVLNRIKQEDVLV
jgi:hypothetical protein